MKISKFLYLLFPAILCLGVAGFQIFEEKPTLIKPEKPPHLVGELGGAGNIEISPDGKWIFAEGYVDNQSVVRLWNLQNGNAQDVKINGDDLTWTRDNRLLDTGLRSRDTRGEQTSPTTWLYSPSSINKRQQFGDGLFAKDDDNIQQANVSPDGTEFWLLTYTNFRRFRTKDGQLLSRISWGGVNTKRSIGTGNLASLSYDGREILQEEKKINFYSTKTGKRLRQLPFIFRPVPVQFRGNSEFEEWLPVADWKNTPEIFDYTTPIINEHLSVRAIRNAYSGKVLRREYPISDDAALQVVQDKRFKYYLDGDKIWQQEK